MAQNQLLFFVYFISSWIFSTASEFQWPANIPKCKPGDETCIPQTLTQLFRHSSEIPGLNVPNLDPFVWDKGAVLRTRNPNAPINIVIRNSNTTIYGLNAMEITQIKGFGPDPRNTKFEIKSFVPLLVTVANYKSTMNLFALPITTEGVSNTTIKNLEIRQIVEADVIEKDGKEYLDIKNVRVHMKVNKLTIKFDSRTGNPQINETVNKVINDNWRDIYAELKPDLEKNTGEVIKSIIRPIFVEIPYREFYSHPN